MPRIVVAALKQETATFNPAATGYDQFRIERGADVLRAFHDTQTELAGAVEVFEQAGNCQILPGMSAMAVSGGPIPQPDLDRLLAEIVTSVRDAGPVDGAYVCLHGAMAGEREGDPEGRLLSELRQLLGDRPLVASLDLHAVLSDRMVASADVLVPYHTYPHVDQYSTGQRAAWLLLRLLAGEIRPVTARVRLPMLVRGDQLLTATGKFGEAIAMCGQIEEEPGGLAAGVLIGNAFTDVPDLQSNVLVTRDGDRGRAERDALRIARFLWEHRHLFQAELVSLDEAIQLARHQAGLTIFSDAADATASGASGDSNAILRGLLESGFEKSALLALVDAPAVAAAIRLGVGAAGEWQLGGTRDPRRFQPLTVRGAVRSLHDGRFVYEDGTVADAGKAAVLRLGAIDVLVTERPVFVVGRRVFQTHGLEPLDYDLVVVKSPNGFRTWYESIAARIVPVDVPGSTSANLKSLPYRHCVRPIFPLDDDVPDPF